jgi:hypothetical protein
MLSPIPTFLLWRRMKLWELRSYDQVIKLEQERLVYQARLRSRFGRAWRRKAPVESLMPLRLARYGVPLADTAPAGLAAAGIEPALLPPAPQQPELAAADSVPAAAAAASAASGGRAAGPAPAPQGAGPGDGQRQEMFARPDAGPLAGEAQPDGSPWLHSRPPQQIEYHGGYNPAYDPQEPYDGWYQEQLEAEQYQDQYQEEPPLQEPSPEDTGTFPVPVHGNRTRQLGEGGGTPAVAPTEEDYYQIFRQSIDGSLPTPRVLGDNIQATYGTTLSVSELKNLTERFQHRFNTELEENHIA